jgi:ketosteroid isomerase-like protein
MTSDGQEAAVRAAMQRWLDGTVKADADALDELLEDDYFFTHATTAVSDTRAEWLDSFRSGRRRYELWEVSDVSVQLYPGVAVVKGKGHQEIPRADGLFDLRTSFMATWIERDGRWRCAGWQATLVPSA